MALAERLWLCMGSFAHVEILFAFQEILSSSVVLTPFYVVLRFLRYHFWLLKIYQTVRQCQSNKSPPIDTVSHRLLAISFHWIEMISGGKSPVPFFGPNPQGFW
jgi:hypothetical protein